MENIGISLGWNCGPAGLGVQTGLRTRKEDGYKTCPFDEMISNMKGVIECIKDDFKYFLDDDYLKIKLCPFSSGGLKKGEYLIYNTKYNFIFNHESPGHAGLYLTQNWDGGMNHYIHNNFKLFKERYQRRIDNFKQYINSGGFINFIVSRYNNNLFELDKILHEIYPELRYKINLYQPIESKNIVYEHYLLMGMKVSDVFKEFITPIQLVIAKFNEDISWIEKIDIPYIIYNKGDFNENFINIPNNGREGETYLRYIIENYDNLPENIIFSQGNPFEHSNDFINIINNYNSFKEPLIIGLSDWIETEEADSNGCFVQEGSGIKDILPLLGINKEITIKTFCTGAQYIIPNKYILNKPKSWWIHCYNIYNNNPRSPWIFERIWLDIFYHEI